jgi:hypothetical protein
MLDNSSLNCQITTSESLPLINPYPFCLNDYKRPGTLFVIDYRILNQNSSIPILIELFHDI